MDRDYVESISLSLIREFLNRKGLKRTLESLDREKGKTAAISSRVELANILNLDNLIQQNNDSGAQLRTFAEMIVHYLMGQTNGINPEAKPYKILISKDDMVLTDTVGGETVLGAGRASTIPQLPTAAQRKSLAAAGSVMPTVTTTDHYRNGRRGTNPTASSLAAIAAGRSVVPTAPHTVPTQKDNVNPHSITHNLRFDSEATKPKVSGGSIGADLTGPNSDQNFAAQGSSIFDIDNDKFVKRNKEDDEAEFERALTKLASKKNSSTSSGRRSKAKKVDDADLEYNVAKSSMSREGPPKKDSGPVDAADSESLVDLSAPQLLRQKPPDVPSAPIDRETAIELKCLIFGKANAVFTDEWIRQSFTFCDIPKLQFGIVQKKGGPCGVLACVQSAMLQELLFKSKNKQAPAPAARLECGRSERSAALARGLARCFWRAGETTNQAKVVLPSKKPHFLSSSRCKGDGFIEMLTIYTVSSLEELQAFLQFNVGYFECDGNQGVILALYSAILSRTVNSVKGDMDEVTTTLVGAHGYCTQELVNLFITGRAASNVFNDTMELDSGGEQKTILKGVHGRSDIGLLSLFEHYKSCQVGSYLKTPMFPIWVICSESHFSVLFSLKKMLLSDWKLEKNFDLYYYDGLGKQDTQIRLTVDTTNRHYKASVDDDDLVPPIEHCIRTKWRDCEIDWNGFEPLL